MTEAERLRSLVADLYKIVLETQNQVSRRAWLSQEIQSEAFAEIAYRMSDDGIEEAKQYQ